MVASPRAPRLVRLVLSLLVLAPLVLSAAACGEDDEVVVGARFETLRQAIMRGDGDKALSLVDGDALIWFGEALAEAKLADRAELDQLAFARLVIVLRLRQAFEKRGLDKLDPKQAFLEAVRRHWFDRTTYSGQVARVAVEGDETLIYLQAEPNVPKFRFVRTPEGWKFSLRQAMAFETRALQPALERAGRSSAELFLDLLDTVSDTPVDRAILDGPIGS